MLYAVFSLRIQSTKGGDSPISAALAVFVSSTKFERKQMLAYPPFSLECVTTLARIIRGRTIVEEKSLFAKCGWMMGGSGLGMAFGEPPDVGPFMSTENGGQEPTVEAVTECRNAIDGYRDSGLAASGPDDDRIAAWMKIIEIEINEWLKNQMGS